MSGASRVTAEGGPKRWVAALQDPVSTDAAPVLCSLVVDLLKDTGGVVVCDVAAVRDPAVGTVDALLRMQLAARRRGGRVVLANPNDALLELIARLGMADLLPIAGLSDWPVPAPP